MHVIIMYIYNNATIINKLSECVNDILIEEKGLIYNCFFVYATSMTGCSSCMECPPGKEAENGWRCVSCSIGTLIDHTHLLRSPWLQCTRGNVCYIHLTLVPLTQVTIEGVRICLAYRVRMDGIRI